MSHAWPIEVVREIEAGDKRKNASTINDYHRLRIFDEPAFSQQPSESMSGWPTCNVSFERPRTPPVAAIDSLHIETIAANAEIEDTFLNSEITFLESNLSSCSAAEQQQNLARKFSKLPNFVNAHCQENDTFLKRLVYHSESNYSNEEDQTCVIIDTFS